MLRKQNGSIFSFIAVGLVLVIATGLIIFAINNRTSLDGGDSDQTTSQTDEDRRDDNGSSEESQQDDAENGSAADLDQEGGRDTAEGEATEDSIVGNGSTASDSGEDSRGESSTDSGSSANTPSEVAVNQEVSQGELPETGFAQDLLSTTIGIVAIVGAGYVYYHFGRVR